MQGMSENKYAVVRKSNRDKFCNAQANAKHQNSNNMTKGIAPKTALMLVKARISAAKYIPGICRGQKHTISN